MTSEYYYADNESIEDEKFEAAKGLYQSGNYENAVKQGEREFCQLLIDK